MNLKFILASAIMALFTVSVSAETFETYCLTPELMTMPDGRVIVITNQFKERTLSNRSFSISPVRNYNWIIQSPQIKFKYDIPSISGDNSPLQAFLDKHPNPKIVLRVPEQCENAKFADMIETKLSRMGFTIMDRKSATGVKDLKHIAKNSNADLLIDVSWLSFSDPEMTGRLIPESLEISDCKIIDYESSIYVFDNQSEFEKVQKKLQKKKYVPLHEYMQRGKDFLMSQTTFDKIQYLADLKEHILNDESITINNNVVSALFKFFDIKNGAMIGSFQEGVSDIEDLTVKSTNIRAKYTDYYFGISNTDSKKHPEYSTNKLGHHYTNNGDHWNIVWHAPWVISDMKNSKQNPTLRATLTYVSCLANTSEFPYANQLNDFRDIKLTDDAVIQHSTSYTSTNSTYDGRGATYYNRFFNNSRWGGSGRKNTESSSSSTTTFKDAEWLHPSDFYGYYIPIIDKFLNNLSKLKN